MSPAADRLVASQVEFQVVKRFCISRVERSWKRRSIVFSLNAFAILGLRALYFCLAGMAERFRYLNVGLGIILAFVGINRDPRGRLGLRIRGKGGRERVVRIRDDLFGALASLHGPPNLDARDRSPLLPDSRGTAYSVRGLRKLVAQAVTVSGIAKPASPHWLRHTHATLAAENGASALLIQSALGHKRLETSQRYIHWAKGLEETTVDKLPAVAVPRKERCLNSLGTQHIASQRLLRGTPELTIALYDWTRVPGLPLQQSAEPEAGLGTPSTPLHVRTVSSSGSTIWKNRRPASFACRA
jgi:Phage integrase family